MAKKFHIRHPVQSKLNTGGRVQVICQVGVAQHHMTVSKEKWGLADCKFCRKIEPFI